MEVDYNALIPIVQTILTGVGGAGALYLAYVFDRWKKKKPSAEHQTESPLISISIAIAEAPDLLYTLFERTKKVDRLLLLRSYGVSYFEVIKIWYADERTEDKEFLILKAGHPPINLRDEYDGIETDLHYRQLLDDLDEKGIWLKTENMAESMLQNFYEAEGVTESYIFLLCKLETDEGKQIFYGSIATHSKTGFDNQGDKQKVISTSQQARQLFKDVNSGT
jgi:hypothetical protein